MNPRNYPLLLHPLFILSVFLLLLNDISLKYQFHNDLTGKLSDFTGLFAFALFGMAIWPKRKKQVAIACALFFAWWKSPFSSAFIHSWNETMPLQITRVIDYWDLTALVMLPLAVMIAQNPFNPRIRYRKFFIPIAGSIALFSFCFTTAPRYGLYYSPPNQINFYGDFTTRKTEAQIVEKLVANHISFYMDSIDYHPLVNGEYYMKEKEPNDSVRWVRINNSKDSVVYIRRKESPFYIIPHYNLDGHELKDVKIRIDQRSKRTDVFVTTFQWDNKEAYTNELRKKYKKHFKKLFE